jgi:hypothetical protein
VIVTSGLRFPALRLEFKSAYRFPRRLSSSRFVHRLRISSIISDFPLSYVPRLLRFLRRRISSAHLHSTSPTLRATFPTFPIFRVSPRYVVRQSRLSHLVPPIVRSHRAIVGPFPLSLRTIIVDYLTYYTLRRPSQFLSFGCWFVLVGCLWDPFRLFVSRSDIRIIFWCSPVSPHIILEPTPRPYLKDSARSTLFPFETLRQSFVSHSFPILSDTFLPPRRL